MTQFLDVTGGRLAYDDAGSGPLVVAVPGMGDLRSTYRFVVPRLVEAGYRVVTLDVRGHGETSVAWDDYTVGAVATDLLGLIRSLGAGPAHVIGNSMAAAAATIAAARDPEAVRSLTLVGPFVRDVMPLWVASSLMGTLLGGPWRGGMWRYVFKKAFPTSLPPDFDENAGRLHTNLAEAGRFEAFRRMAVASKAESERSIGGVVAPVLVLMGTKDRDFPAPAKEAKVVGGRLHGKVVMIEGAGHYPHAEMPDVVMAHLVPFLQSADGAPGEDGHAA